MLAKAYRVQTHASRTRHRSTAFVQTKASHRPANVWRPGRVTPRFSMPTIKHLVAPVFTKQPLSWMAKRSFATDYRRPQQGGPPPQHSQGYSPQQNQHNVQPEFEEASEVWPEIEDEPVNDVDVPSEPPPPSMQGQWKQPPGPNYTVYRATKDPSKGGAACFAYSRQARAIYLQMAAQSGEKLPPRTSGKQFGWDKKLTMKLGARDMVTLLKVLELQAPECDLIHQSDPSGPSVRTTSIKAKIFQQQFQQQQQQQQRAPSKGLQLTMYRSQAGEKESRSVVLDEAECQIVAQFFRHALKLSLGFSH